MDDIEPFRQVEEENKQLETYLQNACATLGLTPKELADQYVLEKQASWIKAVENEYLQTYSFQITREFRLVRKDSLR